MTTLATCWKITRQDAIVEGYTDHDADLVIGGTTYLSSAGYVPSAIERKSDLSANNQQVVGLLDADSLSAQDLLAGVYDGARVDILLVDWSVPALVSTLLAGHLGAVQLAGDQYTAELQSLEAELNKPIGRTVQLRCDADLGDARCGYTLTGTACTVTSVTSARVFIDSALTAADGLFDGGKVVWQTGANAGRSMDVKTYTAATDTVELYEPMASAIEVGDTALLYRGCDKTFATCRDIFANAVNFRGFPYVPGNSNVLAGNT